ncbi:MAG: hypothetical protein JWO36_3781 [Myxococcales bacterium]|nr:hypothetical protein [Myxococcales bacterium]
MTFEIARLVDDLQLYLGEKGSPMYQLARENEPQTIVDVTQKVLACAGQEPNRAEIAVLHILACALVPGARPLDSELIALVHGWMARDLRMATVFVGELASGNALFLEELFERLISEQPSSLVQVFGGSIFLPQAQRDRVIERIASDPREAVREHFFALLGQHRRLVPPGSIELRDVTPEALDRVLRTGIDDPVSKVRERAIAATYGLGAVDRVRDRLLARVRDESIDVRQYAIISLGAMRDEGSGNLLLELLEHGTDKEVTSAIWALARRPDGVERVLELAGDPRSWIEDELLGAFAEVAAPMTDKQIERLGSKVRSPAFSKLRARHLDRTRRGAPELGPDGRVQYVMKSDSTDAKKAT